MTYDTENIFAKILRGEIPNTTVYENEYVLAFEDINPQAPIHILIVPKGPYTDMADFSLSASGEEQVAFTKSISEVVKIAQLEATGFRAIANTGIDGLQEVPHYHLHILGGGPLGPMVNR
ncbi:HIT domain-containing protein [Rhodospirillaceae bacterium]|nr:HIT domain-containing protein [Rhodospirillaceae bacterium]MBT6307724.1 HIT domain-containing protein [Rhodospirillaceae bacterium]MBT7732112.1 HIT domain-containing protein [Rhodospirillaceae bacterium]MDC0998871.1 HIT domain-containing protein [Alphaproteobacteria bacterium]MDC1443013.1 HIT domain-containing protein [Rhodospirillaceae bacterium]